MAAASVLSEADVKLMRLSHAQYSPLLLYKMDSASPVVGVNLNTCEVVTEMASDFLYRRVSVF